MNWQTALNMEIAREKARNAQMIEQAKKESKRVYLLTTRFTAEKCNNKYLLMEEEPYVGNEELEFTITPIEESLLKGIANYETIEDIDKKDLTAVVTIGQGSLMQYPIVEGIGYQDTFILFSGKKKDSYLDAEEVSEVLKRKQIIRRKSKEIKEKKEEKTI